MFAVGTIALLCFMSVSHSAPLDCEHVAQTLDQLDVDQLEGRWGLLVGSLKIIEGEKPPEIDSISIIFSNSTYILGHRYGTRCHYMGNTRISIEDSKFNFTNGPGYNFSGSFFPSPCPHCAVLRFNVDTPHYKSEDLYLFSKRRELNEKQMEWFNAQLKCLNMPKPFVMDPTKRLCRGPATVPK